MVPSLGPIVEAGVSFDRGWEIGYPRFQRGLWTKRIDKKRMSNGVVDLLVSRALNLQTYSLRHVHQHCVQFELYVSAQERYVSVERSRVVHHDSRATGGLYPGTHTVE